VGVCGVLVAVCVSVCRAVGPSWHEVCSLITSPQQTLRYAGADQVVLTMAGVLLWALCGWLIAAAGCCALAANPGRGGRAAAKLARVMSPRLLRRACGVAVGVGLLPSVVPSLAGTAPAYAAVTQVVSDAAVPVAAADVDWPEQPDAPAAPATVTVRPGDCLWSLARAHLDADASTAQISAEVDRWWEANAETIGADPDLLIPGQILAIPSD